MLDIAAVIGLVAMIDAAGHAFGCGISFMLGLVFLVAGGIVLSSATPDKPGVSAQIGPTGGSFRVTF